MLRHIEVFRKTKNYFQSYLVLANLASSGHKSSRLFIDLHQRNDHRAFIDLMVEKFECELVTIELFDKVHVIKNISRLFKYSLSYFTSRRRLVYLDELYSLSFAGLSTLKYNCRNWDIRTIEIVHGLVNWKVAYSKRLFSGVDTIYSYEQTCWIKGPQVIVDSDVRNYVLGPSRNRTIIKSLDTTLNGYWLDGEIINKNSIVRINRFIEDNNLCVLLHPTKANGVSLLEGFTKDSQVVFYGYFTSALIKMQKAGFRVIQVIVTGDNDQEIIENVDIYYLN